jgi:hypothetical protein
VCLLGDLEYLKLRKKDGKMTLTKLTCESFYTYITESSWLTQQAFAYAIGYSNASNVSRNASKLRDTGTPFPPTMILNIHDNDCKLAACLCCKDGTGSNDSIKYTKEFFANKVETLFKKFDLTDIQKDILKGENKDPDVNEYEEIFRKLISCLDSKKGEEMNGDITSQSNDVIDNHFDDCKTSVNEQMQDLLYADRCYLESKRTERIRLNDDKSRIFRNYSFNELLCRRNGTNHFYELKRSFDRTEFQTDEEYIEQKYRNLVIKINKQPIEEYYHGTSFQIKKEANKRVGISNASNTDWEIVIKIPIKDTDTVYRIEIDYESDSRFEVERDNYSFSVKAKFV